MKRSQMFIRTSKSAPADEQAKNAQLLIRAGFVHKEMAGVYAYTPLGLRVLENIKTIVREEMNAIGGEEVMMTTLQPREVWEKTDRWDDAKVDNWFKTKLSNGAELGVGLTHEEPIVDMVSQYASSYKDFPVLTYQIQNKYRNELRAKSGLMRGREFVMKDLYSFSRTEEEHLEIYEQVIEAYHRVYDRLGLGNVTYRTYADGGIFTNKLSDEFQTISPVGEDTVLIDEVQRVGINEEVATDENLERLGLSREKLKEVRGVEVGNTFHLESRYSDALDMYYTDKDGERKSVIMGSYGIGVSRLMGMIAEHFSDERGLVWPEAVAPAKVYLVTIGKSDELKVSADELYGQLIANGVSTIFDDRDERPGAKFTDGELMGVPYTVTISDRLLEGSKLELKSRSGGEPEMLTWDELFAKIV